MTQSPTRRSVAYVHHTFPSQTATFVYREVRALGEASVNVVNIACKRPAAGRVHAEAEGLARETLYLAGIKSASLYVSTGVWMFRRPFRFAHAAWRLLTAADVRGMRRPLRAAAEIVRACAIAQRLQGMPRVAHVHAPFSTEPASMAWMVSRLTGLPFSFTSHTAFDARLLPEKLRDARFVASISRFDSDKLMQDAGAPATDKLHVVHCGVNGLPTRRNAVVSEAPVIASVGSLIEKKGHSYLIRACALLMQRGVRFACKIAGGGPLAELLRREIEARNLGSRVELIGPCDQRRVQSLYADAAVFALGSVRAENGDMDGIPVVLMEAMAAGVPCVSTRVSGIPELIRSPDEGILVEEKDPVALADAIERLLKDPELRARIARAARAKVEREFNLKKSAEQLAELFRRYGAPEAAQ
jgi:glycosyltransferase involved in cell wall biosynthesis